MQVQRPWSDADAYEAVAELDRLCSRLVDGAPVAGDVSEWARLTLNVPVDESSDDSAAAIDCGAVVARYGAFWQALAQRPRVAEIVAGQRWPPSVTDVAAVFDSIAVPGGIVDVGQGDPVLDLPASLDRRMHRRDLLRVRGPGTVDPAFPDPLPRWKRVLSVIAQNECGDTIDHDGAFSLRGRGAYLVVIVPPSMEPDEDGGYAVTVELYYVGVDGDVHAIAVGIVEWDETNNWAPAGRGDVFNSDRAETAVGVAAPLLPAFLRRLSKGIGIGDTGIDATRDDATRAYRSALDDNNDDSAERNFDCTPGWVAGADEVRGALVQIGSVEGLPQGVAAYDPGMPMPVLATWLDPEQLRLAVMLFAGQRAAKTARAIADADAARSLGGAASAIYRGPAFGALLPEAVAQRLAFHRWVRGCAGARDRPQYEEALWHWPEQSAGDSTVQLDAEPDARVDPRRTSCGAEAATDILAAAESLGFTPSAVEMQRPRLLCAPLARDAIRAGAWAAFGVWPLDPDAFNSHADNSTLTAQRGPWRRACAGTASQQDMADLVASARDVGLALEDEDTADPGRLCAKLALVMAL
nr:hypothetical protein [Pandoravirus massiliensis]